MSLPTWRRLAPAVSALLLGAAATPAAAQTLIHDFELNGSLADAIGGATLTSNGGSIGAAGYTFGLNQGPTVSNAFAGAGTYSIEMYFRLNSVTSGNGYVALIDYRPPTENALYSYQGHLYEWPRSAPGEGYGATQVFFPDVMAHLVVTRSATGLYSGYVNGVQQFSYSDAGYQDAVASLPNNTINLLNDNGSEEPAGFLDFVRFYDAPLSQAQVTARYQATINGVTTPEPGTWALLATGLLGLGAIARRRRTS